MAEEAYKQLEILVNAVGIDNGGRSLIQRDNLLAWFKVRDFILSKMTIEEYAKKMKKHFVHPVVEKRELYVNEYLRIADK